MSSLFPRASSWSICSRYGPTFVPLPDLSSVILETFIGLPRRRVAHPDTEKVFRCKPTRRPGRTIRRRRNERHGDRLSSGRDSRTISAIKVTKCFTEIFSRLSFLLSFQETSSPCVFREIQLRQRSRIRSNLDLRGGGNWNSIARQPSICAAKVLLVWVESRSRIMNNARLIYAKVHCAVHESHWTNESRHFTISAENFDRSRRKR